MGFGKRKNTPACRMKKRNNSTRAGTETSIRFTTGGFYLHEKPENPNYVLYVLYPMDESGDLEFPALAKECAAWLLRRFPAVVNRFESDFTEEMRKEKFLQAYLAASGKPIFAEGRTLITITEGMDSKLLDYITEDGMTEYGLAFYGFRSVLPLKPGEGGYAMKVYYHESHEYLEIETEDMTDDMMEQMKALSNKHGRRTRTTNLKKESLKMEHPPLYYIAAWEREHPGFNLHYAGETGDADFPSICMQILAKLLADCQTFLCTYGGAGYRYRFPNGWMSREGEAFPAACRRYAAERGLRMDVLFDGGKAGIFPAKGLNQPLLDAYFSNPGNAFRSEEWDLFAYRAAMTAETEFHAQKARLDPKTCDLFVIYTELPNQMEVAFHSGRPSLAEVLDGVMEVCEAHGKTVRLCWLEENQECAKNEERK